MERNEERDAKVYTALLKQNGKRHAELVLWMSEEGQKITNQEIRRIFHERLREGLNKGSLDDVAKVLFYHNDYFKTDIQDGELKDNIEIFLRNDFSSWLELEDKFFKGWFCKSSAKQKIRSIISAHSNSNIDFSNLNLIGIGRLICYLNGDLPFSREFVFKKVKDETNTMNQISEFYLLMREKKDDTLAKEALKRLQERLATCFYRKTDRQLQLPYLIPYEEGIGHFNPLHHLHYRLPREYEDETVQFLRHVARVLYYQILPKFYKIYIDTIAEKINLQEVQIMLVEKGLSPWKVFVAFSPRPPKNKILDSIKEIKKDSLLIGPEGFKNEYLRENEVAFRYSVGKLKKMMKNNPRLQDIWDLLESSDESSDKKINFIEHNYSQSVNYRRHAEEYLCDKAEDLRKTERNNGLEFYIYGKKRPCMTCAGRMKHSRIDHFNQRPGLIFPYAFNEQLNFKPDAAKESLKLIQTTPSHITFVGNKTYGASYDTDSENEDEIEQQGPSRYVDLEESSQSFHSYELEYSTQESTNSIDSQEDYVDLLAKTHEIKLEEKETKRNRHGKRKYSDACIASEKTKMHQRRSKKRRAKYE